MSNPAPWFQFFPGDWLMDKKVSGLSLAAQGAYIRLMCHMWESSDGSLVAKPLRLARMLGLTLEEFQPLWDEIQDPDEPILKEEDGRVWSGRLLEEREKAFGKRQQSKKAAEARWDKGSEGVMGEGTAPDKDSQPPEEEDLSIGEDEPDPSGVVCDGDADAMRAQCGCNAGAMQTQCGRNADAMQSQKPEARENKTPPGAPPPGGPRKAKLDSVLAKPEHELFELARWFQDSIWARYPPRKGRKAGRAEAWEWVCRKRPGPNLRARIEAKLLEDLASRDWRDGVGIKDCVRWLRAGEKNGWRLENATGQPGDAPDDDPFAGM